MELARNLKVESVIRLKPTEDYRLLPEATVTEAIFLMREKKIGCVLVCNDDHLLGLFTERDLIRRVLARRLPLDSPIKQVMTPSPVVVSPSTQR